MLTPQAQDITFDAITGLNYFIHYVLAYRMLLKVKLNGTGFDIILSGTPVNRQVLYISNLGQLQFPAAIKFAPGTTIYVLYRNQV